MKTVLYERLFLLNHFLEQVATILVQFQQEGLIHPEYVDSRKRTLEDLRADLSHVLTGMLHRRELEKCVALATPQVESNEKSRHSAKVVTPTKSYWRPSSQMPIPKSIKKRLARFTLASIIASPSLNLIVEVCQGRPSA